GQSNCTPRACLFAPSHTADQTPEPPPTSSHRIGPAFAMPSRSAAIPATGNDSVAMAGTSICQYSLSSISALKPALGLPVFTAWGSLVQSVMLFAMTSAIPARELGFPFTRKVDDSGVLRYRPFDNVISPRPVRPSSTACEPRSEI